MPTPSTPAATQQSRAAFASVLPIVTVVAALLYAGAWYVLLLKPKISPLLSGGALDSAAADARIKEDETYLARIGQVKDAFNKLNAERRAKIGGIVPSDSDIPGIFVQTDAIATRTGFALVSIDAVADEKTVLSGGRKTVRVAINLAGGDYPQFKVFLSELEQALRISDPQSVIFTSGGNGFGVVFRTYYVDPTPASGLRGR